jgi:hypothetical protein
MRAPRARLCFLRLPFQASSVSHFPRPDDPSGGPVIPETPRWHRRHSGVLLMVAVFVALGWAGWRYSHPTPPPGGAPEVIDTP